MILPSATEQKSWFPVGKQEPGSLLYLIGVSKFRMFWNSKDKSLPDIHSEDFSCA